MSLRERKIAKKKEDILRSAVRILAEKGYQGTTMEDIAANLLMTKGAVYYYFRDKQDLLYQSHQMLLERSIENVKYIQQQDISIEEKLKHSMVVHVEHVVNEQSGFELMLKPEQFFSEEQQEKLRELQAKYSHCFDEIIQEGIQMQVFRNLDKKIARNILFGAMNWVTQWYTADGKKDKKEIAAVIADYLMLMLLKNK
ncbi:TetR/AcrR family transcriptional regulator [Oceanobacillus polygoni]|uniref:AcrR family transcriptional regulator n=1 Tax=Oceanobacillus polygoni TaxID=1235259 RepID=A0A9X0YQH1_9BACI|nr:TetR/AcrR family transcriptional regulator [Oceanobacillus polygoni]MBP2077183.1 AcrR family transcriptional regulator [Oceanobacillus polygoni]